MNFGATTKKKKELIYQQTEKSGNLHLLFIESPKTDSEPISFLYLKSVKNWGIISTSMEKSVRQNWPFSWMHIYCWVINFTETSISMTRWINHIHILNFEKIIFSDWWLERWWFLLFINNPLCRILFKTP